MVTRCAFDYALVQHAAAAGVQVYDTCQVRVLETQPRGLAVRAEGITWRSRYIAFADGAKGTLRRQLGFTATAPHDIGLDLEVAASAACPWTPDTLYIDWGTYPQTYAWAFPKATHWSIGVKGPAPQGHALAHYLRQFMQRWQLTSTDGKLRYQAHMLPTRAPGTPLVRERALVLGDAAGLLEPFTGEGIYYALRSAYLAAEALTAASMSDTSPWSYEAAVDTEIMPDLAGGKALQQVFDYVHSYNQRSGRQIRCYVATHSLLNYAHWQIVSPESSLARVNGCDGYIAQVWTGTSRTPNMYRGQLRERTFETAFLEYGAMQNLVRSTGRRVWYLNDPIEDNPNHDWEDYRRNWEATLTASLLQPEVWRFEIAPWPERIFSRSYPRRDCMA